MRTSDWLAVALGMALLMTAVIGVLVTLYPPRTRRSKKIVSAIFLLFVIAALSLVCAQQIRTAKDRTRTQVTSKADRAVVLGLLKSANEKAEAAQRSNDDMRVQLTKLFDLVRAKSGSNPTSAQILAVTKQEIAKIINREGTIAVSGTVTGSIRVTPPKPKLQWIVSVCLPAYGTIVLIWYCVFCLAGVKWSFSTLAWCPNFRFVANHFSLAPVDNSERRHPARDQ